ncbi:MAG: hypothetical protein ACOX2M_03855 [Fastidiosipilaceae bacterium]
MNELEIVKDIMNETGTSNAKMGRMVGATHNAIFGRFKQNTISVKNLNAMLRALDYKIVIQPRGDKTPSGAYVVERED